MTLPLSSLDDASIRHFEITSVFRNELDWVAPLVADPPDANATIDTDTHLISDLGDTMPTSSIWLYRFVSIIKNIVNRYL